MRVTFALFALLAAASFSQAAPCQCGPGCDCGPLCDCFSTSGGGQMTYAECQTYCIAHNQPMPVAVGKCEYEGDMVRANWLADLGYADGVHWFAPSGSKMYYVGTTKPALVNGSYFQAATVQATSGGCASGNCPTSSSRGFFRR